MQQVGRKPLLPGKQKVWSCDVPSYNYNSSVLLSLRQTHYKLLKQAKPLNKELQSGEAFILVTLDVGGAAQLPWVVRRRDQVSHKHY